MHLDIGQAGERLRAQRIGLGQVLAGKGDGACQHVRRRIVIAREVSGGARRHQRANARLRRHRGGFVVGSRLTQECLGRLVESESRVGLTHRGQELRAHARLAPKIAGALFVAYRLRAFIQNLLDRHGVAAVLARVRQLEQRDHEARGSIGGLGLGARDVALFVGDEPGGAGEHAQCADARDGDEADQPIARRAAPGPLRVIGGNAAQCQARLLDAPDRCQLLRRNGEPVIGALVKVPDRCIASELVAHAQQQRLALEPLLRARPGADQRLVGEIGHRPVAPPLVGGHAQAARDHAIEEQSGIAPRGEAGERSVATCRHAILGDADQLAHDVAKRRLRIPAAALNDLVGRRDQGASQAASILRPAQQPPVAPLVEHREGIFQQRQRFGIPRCFAQQLLVESHPAALLPDQTGGQRGLADHFREFVGTRRHQCVRCVSAEALHELGMALQAMYEIAAQRGRYPDGRRARKCHQRGEQ